MPDAGDHARRRPADRQATKDHHDPVRQAQIVVAALAVQVLFAGEQFLAGASRPRTARSLFEPFDGPARMAVERRR